MAGESFFLLTKLTHRLIYFIVFLRSKEREGLTNNDDAQTKTSVEEEVLPEAWA